MCLLLIRDDGPLICHKMTKRAIKNIQCLKVHIIPSLQLSQGMSKESRVWTQCDTEISDCTVLVNGRISFDIRRASWCQMEPYNTLRYFCTCYWYRDESTLTFRHRASSIQDRHFATLQRTLFIYLINKYISLSDIFLTVHH